MIMHGFKQCTVEHGVYYKKGNESSVVLIRLYVDDLLVTGSDPNEIENFKGLMKSEFEMTDLGKLTYFLGMEYLTITEGIIMHQRKYTGEVLKWFNMLNCNPANTPAETNSRLEDTLEDEKVDPTLYKQLIGSLRYLCNSMSDICYAVGLVNRFMHEPTQSHLTAAKRILRYLRGTQRYGVLFPKAVEQKGEELLRFSDSG